MTIFKGKQYDQMVKSKKKELKVELIKKEDFIQVIHQFTQVPIVNPAIIEQLQELL